MNATIAGAALAIAAALSGCTPAAINAWGAYLGGAGGEPAYYQPYDSQEFARDLDRQNQEQLMQQQRFEQQQQNQFLQDAINRAEQQRFIDFERR
jgi:membrane peptidoglycan carboxypeptidase